MASQIAEFFCGVTFKTAFRNGRFRKKLDKRISLEGESPNNATIHSQKTRL
jgi:hypothetical protein